MDQSIYNPYLLQSNKPFSIIGLQTNNTLFLVDKTFTNTEQNKLYKAKFIAKEWEQLTINTPIKFNSRVIQLLTNGSITLTQEQQYTNLSIISTKLATSTGLRGATRTLTPKD